MAAGELGREILEDLTLREDDFPVDEGGLDAAGERGAVPRRIAGFAEAGFGVVGPVFVGIEKAEVSGGTCGKRAGGQTEELSGAS